MEVEYFLIEKMWADVLNKPKQGNFFREFRGNMMKVILDYDNYI